MSEFADRVQHAVGDTYRIEKELGGGGMSRVFLAEEVRLGREVVIKVLPPEMAAGVNADRFEREIQLAAKLQHPHIVPLLTAGSSEDILFYVMPFIEGEPLRAKLAREGELPVDEAVRILRDVLDALSYAHDRGIVHRDIKPDNVLLPGHHAVITDFGVAKAMQSSTTQASLTSVGVALGTPAYMAPEQAVADPQVDHRADLYAWGAMAYEMLTGRPPFSGPTPQAVLVAHVTDAPEPVTAHRATVPASLAAMIESCLAKKPADRPQRAEEMVLTLDAVLASSGDRAAQAADPDARAWRAQPWRVGMLFVLAAVLLLGVVYGAMRALGLPNWVFGAAVGLVAVGLPVMMATAQQERRRAMAGRMGVRAHTPRGIRRLFTWNRALAGSGVAFAALAVVVGGVMTMRSLGLAPFATLLSSGALKDKQTIILADFVNHAADSTLGATLTEAFRVDLEQSPTVTLMDQAAIAAALGRMKQPVTTKLTPEVAHDVAVREGVSALVTGQIDPVGSRYALSASVMSVDDGKVLAAVRTTAQDEDHVLEALERLSRDLRAKIGESLVTIRKSPPLAQVTTSSLDALRAYTDALARFDAGDYDGAIGLLKQAIGLDSGFAMAYRKLAAAYSNAGGSFALATDAATRAFELRDRLPPMERDLTIGYYYLSIDYQPAQAMAAYRAVLERDSTDVNALGLLAHVLDQQRDYAGAEGLFVRAAETGTTADWLFFSLALVQGEQGHYDAADTTLARWKNAQPDNPRVALTQAGLLAARGEFRGAAHIWQQVSADPRLAPALREQAWQGLANVAIAEGRYTDATAATHEAVAFADERHLPFWAVHVTAGLAATEGTVAGRATAAAAELTTALQHHPLESIPPADRPYSLLITAYALLGRLDEARTLNAEYLREVAKGSLRDDDWHHSALGYIAYAEGRWKDAITEFQTVISRTGCSNCELADIATAYDSLGELDSARVYYERNLYAPGLNRLGMTGWSLGPTLERLGELYQAQGDRKKALDYYSQFVDLWKDADPDLQPAVQDVKARMAKLTAQGG